MVAKENRFFGIVLIHYLKNMENMIPFCFLIKEFLENILFKIKRKILYIDLANKRTTKKRLSTKIQVK